MKADGRYITQAEAAELAGVSKDTVIRARRAGRLPGARLVEGRWLVPAGALVAAGLQPADRQEPPDASPGAGGTKTDEPVAAELAAAEARLAALNDLVARQDDELRFLRQLLAETVAKGGRG